MNNIWSAIILLVVVVACLFSAYMTENNIIKSCARNNVYISQDVAMICQIAPSNKSQAKAQQNT